MSVELFCGDCLEVMPRLEANSIDTIITDPPYGLKFMGKDWDHGVPGIPFWKAALRVSKPGAMLLAFGGTRTHHRLMCAIEDAGWEIRDCLMWLYGSGFPKSHDISKALDKTAGAEREISGLRTDADGRCRAAEPHGQTIYERDKYGRDLRPQTEIKAQTIPATGPAKLWEGWGSGLKPAWEPIILAMKPIDGTFAHNALEWSVAGLWIDGGRIATSGERPNIEPDRGRITGNVWQGGLDGSLCGSKTSGVTTLGRWPANLILSHHPDCVRIGSKKVRAGGGTGETTQSIGGRGAYSGGDNRGFFNYADSDGYETIEAWECVEGCPVKMLDEQAGERPTGPRIRHKDSPGGIFGVGGSQGEIQGHNDTGGASRFFLNLSGETRFFYCPKASRRERNEGLEKLEKKQKYYRDGRGSSHEVFAHGGDEEWQKKNPCHPQQNNHPCVKPLKLMEYLCRLTRTPTGGIVLDPFMGSGTTGIAAINTRRDFIGIELEPEYLEIAQQRIEAAQTKMHQLELAHVG